MSNLVTLERLLKERFEEFYNELSEAIVIDQSLFPPNDEVDLLEVTDLLNFLFPDDNTLINLEELLAVKGIEMPEEDKNKILPIIDKILKFVRQVKTII